MFEKMGAAGVRGGCELHAECASLVCDTYAAGGHAKCIKPQRVLYASTQCGGPTHIATGTMDDPFCQIRDAVAAAKSSGKDVIRVMPGFYLPFSVFDQRLYLFGPAGEGGVAAVFEEDSGAARVGQGGDVVIDGFALGGPTHSGFICTAGAQPHPGCRTAKHGSLGCR